MNQENNKLYDIASYLKNTCVRKLNDIGFNNVADIIENPYIIIDALYPTNLINVIHYYITRKTSDGSETKSEDYISQKIDYINTMIENNEDTNAIECYSTIPDEDHINLINDNKINFDESKQYSLEVLNKDNEDSITNDILKYCFCFCVTDDSSEDISTTDYIINYMA